MRIIKFGGIVNMGKKLAICGHTTRGKEVIKLLEMLGGTNPFLINDGAVIGNKRTNCYYISEDTATKYISWDYVGPEEIEKYQIFTLEEFLEKYPFKVGDKVVYTKFGDNCDDYPETIESMKWTGTTIENTFNDCVTCLAKDLKMWNEETDVVISGIYLNSYDYADEVELNLGDYEIEVRDGKTYAVKKKPKYPKTVGECFKLLGTDFSIDGESYKAKQMAKFYRLIVCRDAYWKIAGEEIGLNKSWEPDWDSGRPVYCISVSRNTVGKGKWYTDNKILAFPTEAMRDAFYENFKDLIESCKELL